jgi:hypothetical protein
MDQNESKLGNIESLKTDKTTVLKADTTIFTEEFHFSKIYEDKVYAKFVKNVEKLIRTSREYNSYIEKLRSSVTALNVDNIQSNITTTDLEMEFHHYPFTLYDIVDTVATYNFIKDRQMTSFSVAKEIMDLHFKNLIGLVPLSKTNHELAHNGKLFLSKNQIFGNYKKFMEKYDDALSAQLRERVSKMEELSAKDVPSDFGGLF